MQAHGVSPVPQNADRFLSQASVGPVVSSVLPGRPSIAEGHAAGQALFVYGLATVHGPHDRVGNALSSSPVCPLTS
jgi:hypothetical protein